MILRAIFALALLLPIATGTSMPICIKDSSITIPFVISSLWNYTTQFCAQITSSNFSSNAKNYSMDSTMTSIVSFDFKSATTDCHGDNPTANCEKVYSHLLSGCGNNNSTITGSGSIDTGCGVYTFRLTNTNLNDANATSASSKSGSGKTSGVSYCMGTGSVLLGVAAFFGWFL